MTTGANIKNSTAAPTIGNNTAADALRQTGISTAAIAIIITIVICDSLFINFSLLSICDWNTFFCAGVKLIIFTSAGIKEFSRHASLSGVLSPTLVGGGSVGCCSKCPLLLCPTAVIY